jgi:hypothetical protein
MQFMLKTDTRQRSNKYFQILFIKTPFLINLFSLQAEYEIWKYKIKRYKNGVSIITYA